MKPKDFLNLSTGQVIRSPKNYWAFNPATLPLKINWTSDLVTLLQDAGILREATGKSRN
jgi:hypothetical protein